MQQELSKNEKTLLDNLVNTQGSPLENLTLINLVKTLSAQSVDVKRKMERSLISQQENEEKRAKYKELAYNCASLFFVLLRLVNLDSMYENSLQNFVTIYVKTMTLDKFRESEPENATKPQRLEDICQQFAETLYKTVSQGLFVNHKLGFSLDMALNLEMAKGHLKKSQFEILMACAARNMSQYQKGEIGPNQYEVEKITSD